MSDKEISVCWFRRDLRLNDNVALYHALKSEYPVLPVFIFDKNILDQLPETKDRRVSFIHQTIKEINDQLKKSGSSFYIIHDTPLSAFEEICNTFEVKEVFTNHDYEPYAIERDNKINEFLAKKNIAFHTFKDQVIFEKSDVMKDNGDPYTIFTPYSRIWKQKFHKEGVKTFASEKLLSNFYQSKAFYFPSLREIGFEEISFKVPELHVSKDLLRHYDETRNIPSVEGTSFASVYLRFGRVSVRELVDLADKLNEQWLNELIWREFFMMILFHFPQVVQHNFKRKYDDLKWRNDESEFKLWCKGETGYPLVDAGYATIK